MTRDEITKSREYQITQAAVRYYNNAATADLTDAFEAGARWADLNNRNQTVSFFCISGDKKVTMTVQQLIDYYIEREIDDVASECNF